MNTLLSMKEIHCAFVWLPIFRVCDQDTYYELFLRIAKHPHTIADRVVTYIWTGWKEEAADLCDEVDECESVLLSA